MERPKKKLALPALLAVVVLGGGAALSSCGDDAKPPQDATLADAPQDAAPDVPLV